MGDTLILNETLKAIDSYIAVQQQAIERGKDLEALRKDPKFQRVIMAGYIESLEAKLFKILTDPIRSSDYTDKEIHLELACISHFKAYIGTPGYKGTIEVEAGQAPFNIENEELERVSVTKQYAEDEE